jgi:3-(3-hydroxy-phenyl)propionate hydroxylase
VFLLGDAAHLTPPFIGQGLAAGLRDADNLAWKIAYVLSGQAGEDLLASYEAERRPHARAMIKKAIRVGWAMTGGQDRAAAVRQIALAAAVRSARIRDAIASTQTPRLKAGALRPAPRRICGRSRRRVTRIGGLIPNPLVSAGDGERARLDAVLRGRAGVLTAGPPCAGLVDPCRRHRLLLIQVSAPVAGVPGQAPALGPQAGPGRVEVSPVGDSGTPALRALIAAPGVSVLVRPDRVVADVAAPSRLPRLPWTVPAAAAPAPGRTRPNPSNVIKLTP